MKKTFSLCCLKCFVVILILIYLCLQVYLMLKRNAMERETILSYESILCGNSTVRMMSYTRRKCPKRGITTFVKGTLPNHMWQYANVLATSLELGLEGYIPICLKNSLQLAFANVSVPLLADISHCDITLREVTEPVEEWKTFEDIRAISADVMYQEMVMKHVDEIRRHFVLNRKLADFTANILGTTCKRKSVTCVGVYISERNNAIELTSPEQVILSAMDKFRKEHKNSFFIVVARDKGVWDKILGDEDVCLLDQELWTRPSTAMAVLSQCSHSIIIEWEFGTWATILSGGDAIVSFSLNEILNPLMKLHDNWKYLTSEKQFV